jgi:hypothetical protein
MLHLACLLHLTIVSLATLNQVKKASNLLVIKYAATTGTKQQTLTASTYLDAQGNHGHQME